MKKPAALSRTQKHRKTGDCFIDSGSPTNSFCLGNTNYVGPADHMLLNFDVADNLPSHVQILKAYAAVTLASQSSSTPDTVGVWEAAQPWTNLATWDTYDGSDSWTTPGGDVTGSMEDSQSIGSSGQTGNTFYWDINNSMQRWVDGVTPQDDGLLFQATQGTGAANTLGFYTETGGDNAPYIGVEYEPRMGDYPDARYNTQALSDRSSVGVNVGTGNLMVSNNDLSLAGINGLNLAIGRYYNNLSTDQGSFGVGWSMSPGADSYLEIQSDFHSVVDYFDGTGNAQLYYGNGSGGWISPPGEDAVLTVNGSNTVYTLTFRHSGITETFDAPSGGTPKLARLASISDRNTNTITYSYNGSGQLASIVDSYGNAPGATPSAHTTTISWNSAGYIDEITDPAGRHYQYWQNSAGELTEYEDPNGNTVWYAYDGYGNLTTITQVTGTNETASATTNVTAISYDAGNTNDVQSVQRMVNPSDASSPTSTDPLTTYQFAVASGTCPANAGWMQGTVSDPNQHVSTYCTDDLSRLTEVKDANGHIRSTCYDSDGFTQDTVSPFGILTYYGYTGDGRDNVNAISQNASGQNCNGTTGGASGTPALSTSLSYGDSNNPYMPTSSTDPQNNTNTTTYGTGTSGSYGAGEPTEISDGITTTNPNTHATENNVQLTYNANGTVASSTDADGNQTTYTYYPSTSSEAWDLETITPPSGSGLNPITLCYDSANRLVKVSSINTSNSTGHEVDYSYDNLDHLTQAVYKNGSGSTVDTIQYQFDNDGNMTYRTDPAGNESYDFDGINRLISDYLPAGKSNQYGYDPASNLTSLNSGNGWVDYGYDKANELTSVTNPGASKPAVTFIYDTDGNLKSTTYASGAAMIRMYNNDDQLTSVTDNYKTSTGASAHLGYTYSYANPSTGNATSLIQTVTDQASNKTTYSYDALNRLTQSKITTSSGSTTADYNYSLDGAGNIDQLAITGSGVTNSTTSYAYNPGNEICWSYSGTSTNGCGSVPTGGHAYMYDVDGNQTSNGNGITMAYNALDQMTSLANTSGTTNYGYLGAGQSDLTADGSTALQNDLLGLAASTSGAITTFYTRSTDGSELEETTPSGTYNYLYDGQGDVVGVTDSSGHLVDQYAYDPYGNRTTAVSGAANPFGFQGGYLTSTGLSHFGARFLGSSDGRWTQTDPLDQAESLTQSNRYNFAGDNPVNEADPSGARPECANAEDASCYLPTHLEYAGECILPTRETTDFSICEYYNHYFYGFYDYHSGASSSANDNGGGRSGGESWDGAGDDPQG